MNECFICFVFRFRSSFRILRPYALPLNDREVYNVSNLFFHLFCLPARDDKIEVRVTFAVGNCCN